MGFFKKIFKGVKKGFKSIGKGIKSAFKKFGKFMGKIGILGQVAMMFIMPGIGGALMKGLGGIGQSVMGAMAGSGSAFLQGAAKVMQGAANFVGKASNVFRNVTEGVTNFVGEFSKTAANKLSSSLGFQKVPFADASSTFFSFFFFLFLSFQVEIAHGLSQLASCLRAWETLQQVRTLSRL